MNYRKRLFRYQRDQMRRKMQIKHQTLFGNKPNEFYNVMWICIYLLFKNIFLKGMLWEVQLALVVASFMYVLLYLYICFINVMYFFVYYNIASSVFSGISTYKTKGICTTESYQNCFGKSSLKIYTFN